MTRRPQIAAVAAVAALLLGGCAASAPEGVPAACDTLEEAYTLLTEGELIGDLVDARELFTEAAGQLPSRHDATARTLDSAAGVITDLLEVIAANPDVQDFADLSPEGQAAAAEAATRFAEIEVAVSPFVDNNC